MKKLKQTKAVSKYLCLHIKKQPINNNDVKQVILFKQNKAWRDFQKKIYIKLEIKQCPQKMIFHCHESGIGQDFLIINGDAKWIFLLCC